MQIMGADLFKALMFVSLTPFAGREKWFFLEELDEATYTIIRKAIRWHLEQ